MEIPERVTKCCSVCCAEQPAGGSLLPPCVPDRPTPSSPSHLSCCVCCNSMDVLVFEQSLCPLMAPKWQSQRLARSASLMERWTSTVAVLLEVDRLYRFRHPPRVSKLPPPPEGRSSSRNCTFWWHFKVYFRAQLWVAIKMENF